MSKTIPLSPDKPDFEITLDMPDDLFQGRIIIPCRVEGFGNLPVNVHVYDPEFQGTLFRGERT